MMGGTCVAGWPMVGFMLGAATEDPVGWHRDRQVVKLCSRLTWVMLVPGAVGVVFQGPVWLLGYRDVIDPDLAVLLIVILRMGLGWVLRIGSWATMIWLLARNATPLETAGERPADRRRRVDRQVQPVRGCAPGQAAVRARPRGRRAPRRASSSPASIGCSGLRGVDLAVAQDRDQGAVLRQRDQAGRLADVRRIGGERHLDQVGVALTEGEQPHQVTDGDSLLDERGHDPRGRHVDVHAPRLAEQPLVVGVVDSADGAGDAELGLRQQRGDQVGLVVSRGGDHDVALVETCLLQRRQLAAVGEQPLGVGHPFGSNRPGDLSINSTSCPFSISSCAIERPTAPAPAMATLMAFRPPQVSSSGPRSSTR